MRGTLLLFITCFSFSLFGQGSMGLDFLLVHGQVPPAVQSVETSGATDLVRAGIGLNYQKLIRSNMFLKLGLKVHEQFTIYNINGEIFDLGMESNYLGIPVGLGIFKDYGVWSAGAYLGYEYQRLTKVRASRISDGFFSSPFELDYDDLDRDMHLIHGEFFVRRHIRKSFSSVFGLGFGQNFTQINFTGRKYLLNRIYYRIGLLMNISRRIKED